MNNTVNNMNIEAPFGQTGYGYCSYNIVRKISARNVAIFPVNGIIDKEFIGIDTMCNLNGYNPAAPTLKIWHEFDLIRRVGRGKYGALTFFEIDDLDDKRIISMQTPDVLMVPSQWAKSVCDGRRIDSHVVPMGVDGDIFKPEMKTKDRNIFKVLNCGKWEIRKGHDILAEVFAAAFPDEKDVSLELMTRNPFLKPEEVLAWKEFYRDKVGINRVKFHEVVENHQSVANLINSCDIGIFPSRAEGWNMEALEMLSCGKHIIITNYSAHTQYCTPKNSALINIDDVEPAFDGKWFHGDFNWAKIGEPQKGEMVDSLRHFYKEWKSGATLFNLEGVLTARPMTWWATANKIEELLS